MDKSIIISPHGGGHQSPTMIVYHAMAEWVVDVDNKYHAVQFLDRMGLSAHSLVSPTGHNFRLREDHRIAWHAKGFNINSLGIETLVKGEHDYASFLDAINKPYVEPQQYDEILRQSIEWIEAHEIRQLVKHKDLSPGRKVDPGNGFPWDELMDDLGRFMK